MKCGGILFVVGAVHGLVISTHKLPVQVRSPNQNVVTMRLFGGGGGGSRRGGLSPKNWISRTRKGSGPLGGWFGSGNNQGPPKNPPKSPGSSASDDDEAAKGMWAAYEKALAQNPIFIKGLTSLVGFTLGDLMAQFFIEKKGEYDVWRTIRLASFGFLVHGTTSHWFYGKLDARIPGTGAGAVASKVFIDQVLWNPIFGVLFFGYMGIFEGSGIDGTITKIKRDLLTQVTGSWTVWPLAHAINFKFVPTEQRVLYINTIQIFYNCFLSIIGNKKVEPIV